VPVLKVKRDSRLFKQKFIDEALYPKKQSQSRDIEQKIYLLKQ